MGAASTRKVRAETRHSSGSEGVAEIGVVFGRLVDVQQDFLHPMGEFQGHRADVCGPMAFEEVLLKDILTLESVVLISCFRRLHVLTRMMSVIEDFSTPTERTSASRRPLVRSGVEVERYFYGN